MRFLPGIFARYAAKLLAPAETPQKLSKGEKFCSIKWSSMPQENTPRIAPPSTISAREPICFILAIRFDNSDLGYELIRVTDLMRIPKLSSFGRHLDEFVVYVIT